MYLPTFSSLFPCCCKNVSFLWVCLFHCLGCFPASVCIEPGPLSHPVLDVKEREARGGRRRKSSAGGGHRCSFSPRSLFSWHTTAGAATEALLSIRILARSSPSLNDKRGEQAWAGIIGSFLSAPAMCEDRNNGRDREGKRFKVRFSPAPFSRSSSAPFQSMLIPVHL